jgi:hypothetical protein
MSAIKEFLAVCYERFTSGAWFGASLTRVKTKDSQKDGIVLAVENYFAGMARNQISRPNKISAPNSEKAVWSG